MELKEALLNSNAFKPDYGTSGPVDQSCLFTSYRNEEASQITGTNQPSALRSVYLDSNIEGLKFNAKKSQKLNSWQTFISLIKGYCAIVVLILPKSYQNGGYAVSSLTLVLSCIVSTYCGVLLIRSA